MKTVSGRTSQENETAAVTPPPRQSQRPSTRIAATMAAPLLWEIELDNTMAGSQAGPDRYDTESTTDTDTSDAEGVSVVFSTSTSSSSQVSACVVDPPLYLSVLSCPLDTVLPNSITNCMQGDRHG